jgi:hypothetical protein
MRLWTKPLDEGLHADTGVVSTSIAFRYQKLDQGPEEVEALINNMPSPAKRERTRSTIFEGVRSPLFRESILRFEVLLARMENALQSCQWLAGDPYGQKTETAGEPVAHSASKVYRRDRFGTTCSPASSATASIFSSQRAESEGGVEPWACDHAASW